MGEASAVKVGNGVGLGVSVGGIGVAVGIANCVMATIVHEDETAVPSTSAGANVGVPCGPQAVKKIASAISRGKTFLNIFISIFYSSNCYFIGALVLTNNIQKLGNHFTQHAFR